MTPEEALAVHRKIEASLGLRPGLLTAVTGQEAREDPYNLDLLGPETRHGRAKGPFQILEKFHGPVPDSYEGQARLAGSILAAGGSTPEEQLASYYGRGNAPQGHPTTEEYVQQTMDRMYSGLPGARGTAPAPGSPPPVSAVPPGLRPAGGPGGPPPVPPALPGLPAAVPGAPDAITLGLMAAADLFALPGDRSGALRQLTLPLNQAGKSVQSPSEVQKYEYLRSIGVPHDLAIPLAFAGAYPRGDKNALTPYQKAMLEGKEADRGIRREEMEQRSSAARVRELRAAEDAAITAEGREADRDIRRAELDWRRSSEQVKEIRAAEKAAVTAEEKKAASLEKYRVVRNTVDRLRRLAFGEVDPNTGKPVSAGAFTPEEGLLHNRGDEGVLDRALTGVGNLWESAWSGGDPASVYQKAVQPSLAMFADLFGDSGAKSDRDILRQLKQFPEADWYPATTEGAEKLFAEIDKAVEAYRNAVLDEKPGAGAQDVGPPLTPEELAELDAAEEAR